ncbi:MAG: SPOR domain-containing protein [Sedimenticola sp.]
MRNKTLPTLLKLLQVLILLSFTQHSVAAASKVMERIEAKVGDNQNRITIHFNVPVRFSSQVVNKSANEITIQLQPRVIPGFDQNIINQKETLSWRPSAEIPLNRVVFRGEAIGLSSLSYSFSTSVSGYEIEESRDFFSISLLLKKSTRVKKIKLNEASLLIPPPATEKSKPGKIPAPKMTLNTGGYVINLASRRVPIDFNKIPPIPVIDGKHIYTTQATVEGQRWYRLRLGFYETSAEVKNALKEIRHYYPKAWVDRVKAGEQQQLLPLRESPDEATPSATGESKDILLPSQQLKPSEPSDRSSRMLSKAHEVMTAGDYPMAIRLLNAVLEDDNRDNHQQALEILGLAREHNRQLAHAGKVYNRYLTLYPEGEASERVHQRLAGVELADAKPKEKLRELKSDDGASWETYGSLSQNYRLSGIESNFSDGESEEIISQSALTTSFNISTRHEGDNYEFNGEISADNTKDFIDSEGGDTSLSDAYIEVISMEDNWDGKLGRQRLHSSGILNRFDGAVLGYGLNENIKVGLFAGIPVESSSDIFIRSDKHFYGASAAFEELIENWDFSTFLIDQRIDGLVDRRAIGGEARYFDPTKSFFTLVDYDIHYNVLTTTMLQGNWTFEDEIRVYATIDYRTSPFTTTSNALIGQTVTSISELKKTLSRSEIYQLALDRSAHSRTLSIGGSKPIVDRLHVSADLTVSNTSGTPSSGGVDATEATGKEYYFTLQAVTNDILKQGDVGILSLRLSEASTTQSIALSANSRYPISSIWRVNPRLNFSYRKNKNDNGNRVGAGAFIHSEYRIRNNLSFEIEVDGSWYKDTTTTSENKFFDYQIMVGYRWEFGQ